MERGLARTLAVIGLSPAKITDLAGIKFETANDGFQYLHAALLVTNDGKQFALRQYYKSPNRDATELIGSENSYDLVADLQLFLTALGLKEAALIWSPSIMRHRFQQLPPGEEGNSEGTLLAVFSLLPRHISEATGIVFNSSDPKPSVLRALIVTKNGTKFLLRSLSPSDARMELFSVPGHVDRGGAVEEFLEATEISRDHISWLRRHP